MTKILSKFALVFIISVFFLSGTIVVLANGSHGQFFEKTAGDYWVGLGTDIYTLTSGDAIRFDLNLGKADTKEPVEFTDVWVRIIEKTTGTVRDRTVFAGGLNNPEFGYPGMTYIFHESGEYEFIVKFNNKDQLLSGDISFPLTIEKGASEAGRSSWRNAIIGIILGIVSGFSLAIFFRKKFSWL